MALLALLMTAAATPSAAAAEDVITEIDGTAVQDDSALAQMLDRYKSGDRIILTVLRDTQTLHLAATLKVVPGPSGDARVQVSATGKTYTPQEISASCRSSSATPRPIWGKRSIRWRLPHIAASLTLPHQLAWIFLCLVGLLPTQ